MLKKYKILMSLITLILLGIIAVMFVWLYGTYKNKEEILVAEVGGASAKDARIKITNIRGIGYILHID